MSARRPSQDLTQTMKQRAPDGGAALVGPRLPMEGFETTIFPTSGLHPAVARTSTGSTGEGMSEREAWKRGDGTGR